MEAIYDGLLFHQPGILAGVGETTVRLMGYAEKGPTCGRDVARNCYVTVASL